MSLAGIGIHTSYASPLGTQRRYVGDLAAAPIAGVSLNCVPSWTRVRFTSSGGAASVGTSAPRHLQLVSGELRHHHPSHSTHTTHAPAKASRSSCARPSARRIDILHTTRPAHGSASRVTAIASSTSAQISSRRAGAASTCYPSGSARRTHADMPNLWASEKYGCSPPR